MLPCSGVDGAGFALKALSVPFRAVGVWDVEKRYREHLETHLKGANIYVGQAGNVCSLDWTTIKRPVDVLVSGPLCPPWVGNGVHKAQWDARADVFLHVMKLAICLIKTGELKAVSSCGGSMVPHSYDLHQVEICPFSQLLFQLSIPRCHNDKPKT